MAQLRIWLLHGFFALWLGVAMPLLCIPGVSSNHTHGSHWVWTEPEEPRGNHPHEKGHSHRHTHGVEEEHAHGHRHSHEPPTPDPAPTNSAPSLRTRVSQPTLTRAPGESAQWALANAVGLPTTHLLLPWPLSQRTLDGIPAAPPPAPLVLRPWRPPQTT